MSTLTESLPTIGQPNSTEEPKLRTVLNDIVTDYNGGLTMANLNASVSNAFLPWTIDIDPFTTPATQTNWSTIVVDAAQANNGYLKSSGAQNAQVGWDVPMAAGTWTAVLVLCLGPDSGDYTVSLDGVAMGSPVAGYNGAPANNFIPFAVSTGVVTTTAKTRLLIKMATKQLSSSSYFGRISAIRLRRTA